MAKWTEEQYREYKKSMKNGWAPTVEVPVPDLPGPLDVDDDYANSWEREYADFLEQRRHLKEIRAWYHEPKKWKIAKKTWYTPDFLIVGLHCFENHDVKGFLRDDAAVKIKACAALYPYEKWAYARKKDGLWEITYV